MISVQAPLQYMMSFDDHSKKYGVSHILLICHRTLG